MPTTSTIEILGEMGASLSWLNTGSLGTLIVGENSELYVQANITSTSTFSLNYQVTSGSLPTGLTLNRDGTISGVVPTNTATIFSSSTYNFGISAVDTYKNSLLEGVFSVTVTQSTNTDYTSIFCKPLLHASKRESYKNFITNDSIFIPNLIYRPVDPNFGVQLTPKMLISHGTKKLTLSEYKAIFDQNFDRRKLQFGEIKIAVAKDTTGTVLHEIIYVDILDKYVNASKESIPTSIEYNGITYYPPSVDNMRARLTSQTQTTNTLNPRFTKTVQTGEFVEWGYVKFVPLCFVLPGKSKTILRKINNSGFKFNLLDFEIDRIYVENLVDEEGAKYLLLERRPPLHI